MTTPNLFFLLASILSLYTDVLGHIQSYFRRSYFLRISTFSFSTEYLNLVNLNLTKLNEPPNPYNPHLKCLRYRYLCNFIFELEFRLASLPIFINFSFPHHYLVVFCLIYWSIFFLLPCVLAASLYKCY